MSVSAIEVVWLGHATTEVHLGRSRFVTDPVLRDRVAHLRRRRGTASLAPGPVDAVLLSHLHHDHLDLPSLRQLPPGTPLVVPRGAARLVAAAAPGDVVEMSPGDSIVVAGVRVTAVPADHRSGRGLSRAKGAPLGFVLAGDAGTVYFPGDTDLHPVMAELAAPDVALLPIWGWGRAIGPGHLDPERAAQAAALLRARSVLPVHWGTFSPVGVRAGAPRWLDEPADRFAEAMRRHAPETTLHLVLPGADAVSIDQGADRYPRPGA